MVPKIITIGDTTNDAFIELQDANVNCNIDSEECTISMQWGDKIPYKDVVVVNAVGNSANSAVSTSRLEIPTALVSFLGDDDFGKKCIKALEDENVISDYITIEPNKKTNYHYVLSFNAERTILVRHESFTYNLPNIPENTEWIYFSSVGEAAESFHDDISNWVKSHKNTKLVFQPGTFQMKLGYDRLREVYKNTYLFVCNKQESKKILNTKEMNIKNLLKMLYNHGPKIVIITDGPDGAYAYEGNTTYFVPQYPDPHTPKERTGAGDAFTSTLMAFLSYGYSLQDSLLRAPINSMSVVQHIGAQKGLLTKNEIESYLKKAPKEYKVSII